MMTAMAATMTAEMIRSPAMRKTGAVSRTDGKSERQQGAAGDDAATYPDGGIHDRGVVAEHDDDREGEHADAEVAAREQFIRRNAVRLGEWPRSSSGTPTGCGLRVFMMILALFCRRLSVARVHSVSAVLRTASTARRVNAASQARMIPVEVTGTVPPLIRSVPILVIW